MFVLKYPDGLPLENVWTWDLRISTLGVKPTHWIQKNNLCYQFGVSTKKYRTSKNKGNLIFFKKKLVLEEILILLIVRDVSFISKVK